MHSRGLAMGLTKYKLGDLIEQCDERNTSNFYFATDVRGISTEKSFIETKANLSGVNLTSYKIVKHGEFAYVADTSRRGDKIALAFNSTKNEILISSIYTVFNVHRIIYWMQTIFSCISIVPNLIDFHVFIHGAVLEKPLAGKTCATSKSLSRP